MKRSYMVERIANLLLKQNPYFPYSGFHTKAEEILDLLEKEGMKPPIKERCPVLFTDKFVWEKENE
jgi:hypothetical protein